GTESCCSRGRRSWRIANQFGLRGKDLEDAPALGLTNQAEAGPVIRENAGPAKPIMSPRAFMVLACSRQVGRRKGRSKTLNCEGFGGSLDEKRMQDARGRRHALENEG